MPDARRSPTDRPPAPDSPPGDSPLDSRAPVYRAEASSLHARAERARFAEARESLDRVACWYEVLARYAERWRGRVAS